MRQRLRHDNQLHHVTISFFVPACCVCSFSFSEYPAVFGWSRCPFRAARCPVILIFHTCIVHSLLHIRGLSQYYKLSCYFQRSFSKVDFCLYILYLKSLLHYTLHIHGSWLIMKYWIATSRTLGSAIEPIGGRYRIAVNIYRCSSRAELYVQVNSQRVVRTQSAYFILPSQQPSLTIYFTNSKCTKYPDPLLKPSPSTSSLNLQTRKSRIVSLNQVSKTSGDLCC